MNDHNTVLDVRLDSFSFPKSATNVLRDIRFRLGQKERVAVMGASASGKTTLLKICGGLQGYELREGDCVRSGRFSMLFQDNVLLDYMSVGRNIMLPSSLNGVPADVEDISKSLHIEHLLDVYPRRLSGGERKRVALARGMAYPELIGLIMDEPFTGLDLFLKESILVDLKTRLDKENLACLFSTHSAEEAVYLADRIIILGDTPSTIAHTVRVNLPRNNGALTFQDDSFQKIILKVESLMRSTNSLGAL